MAGMVLPIQGSTEGLESVLATPVLPYRVLTEKLLYVRTEGLFGRNTTDRLVTVEVLEVS